MVELNLPSFNCRLKNANGKVWIFDGIRKKYVVLTPEEWVRQHFIHYLATHLNYPKSLIRVEAGLNVNQMTRRSDIVVYSREGRPWMVVECKSPDIILDDATARQVSVYNKTLKASYVVVTNGLRHLCFEVTEEIKSMKELPPFE
jgi:hypothetical protein